MNNTVFLHHRADGTVKILDVADEPADTPARVFGWYADACVVLRSLGMWPVGDRVNNLEAWTREAA